MSKTTVYFAGLPTDVDVRALFEHFGVPAEGVSISYDAVAEVIKVTPEATRFRTVTQAWRRRLTKEHNVYIRASQGVFTALKPGGRVDLGSWYLRSGARAFRKGHVVVESTDRSRLTAEQLAQADHVLLTTGTAIQAARSQARKEKPSLPAPVG